MRGLAERADSANAWDGTNILSGTEKWGRSPIYLFFAAEYFPGLEDSSAAKNR